MRRLIFKRDKSADNNRSRQRTISWPLIKRTMIGGLAVGALCLVGGAWMEKEALIDTGYELTAASGLALSDIHIRGRNYTSDAHIKQAIGADYGTPLLALSLPDIRANLEQIGWVKSARVARKFPDVIEIDLIERRPMALLQTAAGHRLIDSTGHIIFSADAKYFSHLPVVSGDGAAEEAKFIIEALRTEPELFADVWAIQRISDRRWDVHLRTGMAIKLPEKDAVLAWSKLAIIDRDTAIMKRDLSVIDLRVSGQLIVEPNLPLSKKGQKT